MLKKYIPDNLFNIFSSSNINREIYFKTLMIIYDEYKNKINILDRVECSTLIIEKFEEELFKFKDEDNFENDSNNTEIEYSNKILSNLIRFGWLYEEHDTQRMTREITLPTYSVELLEAFYRIMNPDIDEAEHYIFDIYSNLNSVINEEPSVKYICLINAENKSKSLKRSLQDILHSIRNSYEILMKEENLNGIMDQHFNNYASEVVNKMYHKLKTEDNIYKYRNKIVKMINEIRFNNRIQDEIIEYATKKNKFKSKEEAFEVIRDKIDHIKIIFDKIEPNMRNIDIRHRRYVDTAVTRVKYLQRRDKDLKGNLINLLQELSKDESIINEISKTIKIKDTRIFDCNKSIKDTPVKRNKEYNEIPLRKVKKLDINEVKNKIVKSKYNFKDIMMFVNELFINEKNSTKDIEVIDDDTFNKVIMTYDYGVQSLNKYYKVKLYKGESLKKGKYKISHYKILGNKEE